MGLLKKAKSDAAAAAAAKAREADQAVFVWSGGSAFSGNGGLGPIADQIESVEGEGWHLEHFSTAWSTSMANHLVATCVFRRA